MMSDGEKRYDVAHLDNNNVNRVKRRNHNRHETSSLVRMSTTSRVLQKNADQNLITDARHVKVAYRSLVSCRLVLMLLIPTSLSYALSYHTQSLVTSVTDSRFLTPPRSHHRQKASASSITVRSTRSV